MIIPFSKPLESMKANVDVNKMLDELILEFSDKELIYFCNLIAAHFPLNDFKEVKKSLSDKTKTYFEDVFANKKIKEEAKTEKEERTYKVGDRLRYVGNDNNLCGEYRVCVFHDSTNNKVCHSFLISLKTGKQFGWAVAGDNILSSLLEDFELITED
jgi:hypothetical protein